MSVPALLLRPFAVTPCVLAPVINSITKTTDELLACDGASSGWHLLWTLNITGTLQAGQEYYWEHATDAAGTSWSAWGTTTVNYKDRYDIFIGSDGAGTNTDRYHRVRAYVVPIGKSPPNQCNGPTIGDQAHRKAKACGI